MGGDRAHVAQRDGGGLPEERASAVRRGAGAVHGGGGGLDAQPALRGGSYAALSTSSRLGAVTKRSAQRSSSVESAASMRATTSAGSSPKRTRSCLRSTARRPSALPRSTPS